MIEKVQFVIFLAKNGHSTTFSRFLWWFSSISLIFEWIRWTFYEKTLILTSIFVKNDLRLFFFVWMFWNNEIQSIHEPKIFYHFMHFTHWHQISIKTTIKTIKKWYCGHLYLKNWQNDTFSIILHQNWRQLTSNIGFWPKIDIPCTHGHQISI